MTASKSDESPGCDYWLGCENDGIHEVSLSSDSTECSECGRFTNHMTQKNFCDNHVQDIVGLEPKQLQKALDNKPVETATGGN